MPKTYVVRSLARLLLLIILGMHDGAIHNKRVQPLVVASALVRRYVVANIALGWR
jgi:hypothetical protein